MAIFLWGVLYEEFSGGDFTRGSLPRAGADNKKKSLPVTII